MLLRGFVMVGRLLIAVSLLLWWLQPAAAASIDRGRVLARKHCANCHSIDATTASSHRGAPAFRTLSERYPVESLAEALAEGLSVGHPDMPEFQLAPRKINDFLAFLKSLSAPSADAQRR